MPKQYALTDYSAEVRRLYADHYNHPQLPTEHDIIQAGVVVDRLFPPHTPFRTLQVLVSLNLLNASVKMPLGRSLVTYNYIKGMAACLMASLLEHPVAGVSVYLSMDDKVAYFRVLGVQLSFHYVPLYRELAARLLVANTERQEWEGLELQRIAVELTHMAHTSDVTYNLWHEQRVRDQMLDYHKPSLRLILGPDAAEVRAQEEAAWRAEVAAQYAASQKDRDQPDQQLPAEEMAWPTRREVLQMLSTPLTHEQKLEALHTALNFNIWQSSHFRLLRRRDHRLHPVMRYTGTNHAALLRYLIPPGSPIVRRAARTMEADKLYHVSPQKRVRTIAPSRYILTLTQNNYLQKGNTMVNLCITYGIARYLAVLYPKLRFVNLLNYNRVSVRHHYYTLADLYRVPINSKARYLKVWMAVDPQQLLADFDPDTLPQVLIDEYVTTDDYYREYRLTFSSRGLKGIYAYERYHLLPPIYLEVHLRNYHAHVRSLDGKWAIYSLLEERFKTPFVYDSIWYDYNRSAILATRDGRELVIYQFKVNRK